MDLLICLFEYRDGDGGLVNGCGTTQQIDEDQEELIDIEKD